MLKLGIQVYLNFFGCFAKFNFLPLSSETLEAFYRLIEGLLAKKSYRNHNDHSVDYAMIKEYF